MCDLAPLYGRCADNTTRWHFDAYSGECNEFVFSGCYGNKNNFDDKRSCENACLHDGEPQVEIRTEAPRVDTESRIVILTFFFKIH